MVMQQKNTAGNILLVVTLAAVLSFATYAGYTIFSEYEKLKTIRPTFLGKQYLGVNPQGYYGVRITLGVNNESNLNFKMRGYHLNTYVNDLRLAPVVYSGEQTIRPQSMSPFSFDVYFRPSDVLAKGQLAQLTVALLDFKNLKIKVSGYISGSVDGIKVENFPLNVEVPIYDLIKSKLT